MRSHLQVKRLPHVALPVVMQAVLGEGPTWLEEQERLAFVDIEGKQIHIWDPVSNGLESISTEAVGRPSTLSPSREGNFLVVAIEQAVYLVDIQNKAVSPLNGINFTSGTSLRNTTSDEGQKAVGAFTFCISICLIGLLTEEQPDCCVVKRAIMVRQLPEREA